MSNKEKEIIFDVKEHFNIRETLECGQCFRWEELSPLEYLIFAGKNVCIARQQKDKLVINNYRGSKAFWRNYFDLDMDYGLFKEELLKNEPKLGEAIEYGGGIRILNQDFFEVLISFIVSQNNNIPRIKKCIEALCNKYGEDLGVIEDEEIYAFPSVDALAHADPEDIKELKLGYRAPYIVASAKRFSEEGVPQGTYKEKHDILLSYHGVGPKVANCISLFGLRDFEAFPIDTWVKKIMVDMYGFKENDTKGMQNFAKEKFGEIGGIAQQYLFYYYRDRNVK